ncbi:MAG: hypothetical protein K0R63_1546 [Rickettsiales bacterium]|jgi:hypothetical protein|nr:hypothetical protein [Rickettsiales bacterium]
MAPQPQVTSEQQKIHDSIMELYDFAEQLVDTVEHPDIDNPDHQLTVIEPLIEAIEETANVLSEEYREYVKTGKKPGLLKKRRIENAMRTLYLAITKSKENTVEQLEHTSGVIAQLGHAWGRVTDSLQKHLEKVFSLMEQGLSISFKSFLYSRGGRQEGMTLSRGDDTLDGSRGK